LTGRIFGEALDRIVVQLPFDVSVAHAGVYSIVGSAAWLGGFTQMSIAIVALLVEATMDLGLVPVLMLSVSVGIVVASKINPHAYDEILLEKKGVPFLEAELPHAMEKLCLTAAHITEELPDTCYFEQVESFDVVQQALSLPGINMFPVFDSESSCIGLAPRERLEAAVQAHAKGEVQLTGDKPVAWTNRGIEKQGVMHHGATQLAPGVDSVIQTMCRRQSLHQDGEISIPVGRLMDPVPYSLFADVPLARLYPLFGTGIVRDAIVISKRGDFIGTLSRQNLITAAHSAEKGLPIGAKAVVCPIIPEQLVRIKSREVSEASDIQSIKVKPKQADNVLKRRRKHRGDDDNSDGVSVWTVDDLTRQRSKDSFFSLGDLSRQHSKNSCVGDRQASRVSFNLIPEESPPEAVSGSGHDLHPDQHKSI